MSVSHNILEHRIRSLLVPDVRMSDQLARAKLLSERKLATLLHPQSLNAASLGAKLLACLQAPVPVHTVDLDGAAGTVRQLEKLFTC